MISDKLSNKKQIGWRRIKKVRKNKGKTVRTFKVPDLNFEASSYTEIVNWHT